MVVETDPYVDYTRIIRGQNETIVCEGVKGYSDPCSSKGSSQSKLLIWNHIAVTVLLTYLKQYFI